MKLFELKSLLIEYARTLIPQELHNLLEIPGDGNSEALILTNTKSQAATSILSDIRQSTVSVYISRKEELSGFKVLQTFMHGPKHSESDDVEALVKVSLDHFIESEKTAVANNINIALSSPRTALFEFIQLARKRGLVNSSSTADLKNQLRANPLHENVLMFLMEYREKKETFVFWLRERNTRNRLNEGFWFQGNESYAFVGLYNSWSGNISTKGIGLVFYPTENNEIGVTFEIIFRDETREDYLGLYQSMISSLREKYGAEVKGENDNHYWLMLGKKNAFQHAEKFLNDFLVTFENLLEKYGLGLLRISQDEFNNKLKRVLEIKEQIESGDETLLVATVLPADEVDYIDESADESIVSDSGKENFNVNLQYDSPSEVDELGRQPFVDALFQYIRRLWDNEQRKDAYTIHINGEWGSGKSSVLKLLKRKLESQKGESEKQWIVVDFNAWQNQHMQVPWWILLDTVYKSILKKSGWKSPWVFLQEQWWRVVSMNFGKWVAFLVLLAIVIVTLWTGSSFLHVDKLIEAANAKNAEMNTSHKLGIFVSSISLIGTVWLFLYGIIKSLLPGSEDSAIHYKQNVRDPMMKIKQHYTDITNYTSRNIAVFIDDIDRCDPKFVVQLLEGLQTLFRTGKVLYVIAGDAMWIRRSFEIHYKDLRETITQKGQSLGNFFVEKTLQQSINLPPITTEVKKIYWNRLLSGKPLADVVGPEAFATSVSKINTASKQSEMRAVIEGASSEEEKIVLREKAALKISSNEILQEIKHELTDYHEYLSPNPRSMKRLINNLALIKASNILAGIDSKIDQDLIVRWAILKAAYPTVASDILLNNSKLSEYKDESQHPDLSRILAKIEVDNLAYFGS